VTTAARPRPLARRAGLVVASLLVVTLVRPAATGAQAGGAFPSDDFNRSRLGGEWEVVDPVGDGAAEVVGAGSGDSRLELTVPEGTNHEPWNVNRSLRVLRDAQDTDFTAVARFQSVPTKRYQMQGILVQQDTNNWLRFDVFHDGSRLHAFAGATGRGESVVRLDEDAAAGRASYVRVTRTGATWALATSADGQEWTDAGSFESDLTVSQVGVFAGNAGASPGFKSVADYLFEAGAPVDPEDGGPVAGGVPLDVSSTGPGAVAVTPDKSAYSPGEQVTLTPVVGQGAAFGGWSGDATGGDSPLVVTVDRPMRIVGQFAPDGSAPAISGLRITPRSESGAVSFTTDENATASVQFGPTDALEYGSVSTRDLATEHLLTMNGLKPGKTYHYAVRATNGAGLTSPAVQGTFVTAAAPSVAFESDDFNRDTLVPKPWSKVDPLGDGRVALSGAESADARLKLTVPAGTAHDGQTSVRVMQPSADIDVTVEAKFEALPRRAGQRTGILLQQDSSNWVAFGLSHDGEHLKAEGASTSGGVTTWHIDEKASAEDAVWVQVEREGQAWSLATSADGSEWTEVGSFEAPLQLTAVGPFAANFGTAPPAYTTAVDSFFENSDRIDPEDEPAGTVLAELGTDTRGRGHGEVQRAPDMEGYVPGTEVRLTAVPDENSVFTGWKGDASGDRNPLDVVVEEDMHVEATFSADAEPPQMEAVSVVPSTSSAVLHWRTNEPTTASVSVGTSTAYEVGEFGSPYLSHEHTVTVTGLSAGRTYNFQATSVDEAGHATAAPNATFETAGSGGPAIDVWNGTNQVFGRHGRSQAWANIMGNAADPDGVASMTYSLNGGEEQPITIGPNQRRLQGAGDFNADVPFDDLAVGANEVRLTATDNDGSRSSVTVHVERVEGNASLPLETDWSKAGALQDQAQPVDGKWTTDGDTVRTMAFGYDRVLALGDTSWKDYEVEFPVTVNAIGPQSGSHLSGPALVGFGMNWQGHTSVDGEQPGYFWYPTGALGWFRWYSPVAKFELRGNMDEPVERDNRMTLTFGETYWFKGRSKTVDGGVEYSWKWWSDGNPEPSGWNLKVVEDDGPATGSVILIAHHSDTQFGNVKVTALDP
jgi:regulation of enolase protein 1 (concanavalin A-like superfamily)